MITINANDYTTSAESALLQGREAAGLVRILDDGRNSLSARADKLAGFRSSAVIARAIARIKHHTGETVASASKPALCNLLARISKLQQTVQMAARSK
jgi:hypothetical protein